MRVIPLSALLRGRLLWLREINHKERNVTFVPGSFLAHILETCIRSKAQLLPTTFFLCQEVFEKERVRVTRADKTVPCVWRKNNNWLGVYVFEPLQINQIKVKEKRLCFSLDGQPKIK